MFEALASTPRVNGLGNELITNNPNSAAPFRLSRSQAVTCDQDHDYTHEQKAMNRGLMNKFVEFTSVSGRHLRQRPGQEARDGLLRWQHRHRAVELRAELRHERQFLRDRIRTIDARRAQPDLRPDARRQQSVTCRNAAKQIVAGT